MKRLRIQWCAGSDSNRVRGSYPWVFADVQPSYSALMSGDAIVGTPCEMAAWFWAAIALR
jgi:hypothetical protein